MRPSFSSALLGMLLFSSGALAQATALTQTERFRSVTLPPTSAAWTNDATALAINPAGLSGVGAPMLFYLHERDLGNNQVADSLYFADSLFGLGAGFSTDWMRSTSLLSYRKTAWGLSLGSPNLALGAALNIFSTDQNPSLNGLTSLDLGILFRPSSFLSFGMDLKNVNSPRQGDILFSRQYDIGLGLRPFDNRYSLGIDYVFLESNNIGGGRLAYTLQAEPLRGLVLSGGLSHGLRQPDIAFQLAVTLNGPYMGLTYAGGGSARGSDHVIAVRASLEKYPALRFSKGTIALVDLHQRLSKSPSPASQLFGWPSEDPYLQLTEFLDEAARDPQLTGLVFKLDGLPKVGMGRAEELRAAIYRLRAAGKKTVAILLTVDDTTYSVATAADKVYALPQSALLVNGLSASTIFLGTAMNKLGVHWDVARVGVYKNAPDALTRSTMSAEQQEAVNAYLDADQRQYEAAIWKGRKLSSGQLRAIFAEGLVTPARAKALGLVDDVIVPEQLDKILEELVPGSHYDPQYSLEGRREQRWGDRKKIALIPVLGSISSGKSRKGPLGSSNIAGAETVVSALKRAAEDPSIAAIVLRVDSGGGDGVASDLMYRAVLEAKKKKPVVSSMGDVAASGGYYAAMGADEIFANATTLTGSIGVFVLKPALQELAGKLGISQQTISRGPMTQILDLFRPWNREEQAAAQKWVNSFYDGFISEVSSSRHLSKARVDELARGRVWAGEDARTRGLVDSLGGLQEAIEGAKQRAGIAPSEEIELDVMGEPQGLLSSSESENDILGRVAQWLFPGLGQAAEPLAAQWADDLGLDPTFLVPGLKASLPFHLKVE